VLLLIYKIKRFYLQLQKQQADFLKKTTCCTTLTCL